MVSEQSEKYAYCEDENNQKIIFSPKNSDSFWIKYDIGFFHTLYHFAP